MDLTPATVISSLFHLAIVYSIPGIAQSQPHQISATTFTRRQAIINAVSILSIIVYFLFFLLTGADTFREAVPPLAYLRDKGPDLLLALMVYSSGRMALSDYYLTRSGSDRCLRLNRGLLPKTEHQRWSQPLLSSLDTVMAKVNIHEGLIPCASIAISITIAIGVDKVHLQASSFLATISGAITMLHFMRTRQTYKSFRTVVLQSIKWAKFVLLHSCTSMIFFYAFYLVTKVIYSKPAEDFFVYMVPPEENKNNNDIDGRFITNLISYFMIQTLCVPIELVRLAYSYDTERTDNEQEDEREKKIPVNKKDAGGTTAHHSETPLPLVSQIPTYHAALWALAICLLTGIILSDSPMIVSVDDSADTPEGNTLVFFGTWIFYFLATPCVFLAMIACVSLRRDRTFRSLWIYEGDLAAPPTTPSKAVWSVKQESQSQIKSSKMWKFIP